MNKSKNPEAFKPIGCDERRKQPRACVSDGKEHLQKFLCKKLEILGFATCACSFIPWLSCEHSAHRPNVVLFGPSLSSADATRALQLAAREGFKGRVLLLGPLMSLRAETIREFGSHLGLDLVPVRTPFSDHDLRAAVLDLLPAESLVAPQTSEAAAGAVHISA